MVISLRRTSFWWSVRFRDTCGTTYGWLLLVRKQKIHMVNTEMDKGSGERRLNVPFRILTVARST